MNLATDDFDSRAIFVKTPTGLKAHLLTNTDEIACRRRLSRSARRVERYMGYAVCDQCAASEEGQRRLWNASDPS